MSQFVQLEAAAKEVGKSEVTLRRLIKSGKVGHRKEKTLTGFIYLVDVEQVKSYYEKNQGTPIEVEKVSPEEAEPKEETLSSEEKERRAEAREARAIRLAVTDESGSMTEYWQKRAQAFEERYHRELVRHAEAREELGVWRGKAEQSQEMLAKLLPAVTVRESADSSKEKESEEKQPKNSSGLVLTLLIVVLVSAVAFFGAVALYLASTR